MKKNIIFSVFCVFILSFNITIADELEDIQKTLPKLLGQTNMGTEFIFGFHPCWEEFGANNAIRIYVSSEYETEVRLTIPHFSKEPYLIKKTIPNDIIEFVLTPAVAQPYTRGSGGQVATLKPTQVWKGRGIILESDAPIIAYGVVRYQYTSDGFLAMPVNKCGTTYIASSYRETANFTSQSLTPYVSIIGISDSTKVTFHIGGNNSTTVRTTDDKKWRPYDVLTANLNRGDYWLIASEGPQSDIGGSYVTANQPIAVLSGSHCAYIPTSVSACDYIIEQEIPVNFWDNKYYVSNIVDRKKASVIRLFAKEPNTKFIRNGEKEIGYLTMNFGMEGEGWLETRHDPDTNKPAVITSNKPINIVQYNQGMSDDNVPSDPFQMNVLPLSAFQKHFVFNTPGIRGGYGFRKNYINLIYKPTINKQIPDYLELGEVWPNKDIKWTKIKDIGGGLGSPFVENSETTYYNKIIPLPYDAIYHIKSEEPVMVYLYGFADWDSYGYPASGFFADTSINDDIAPKIDLQPVAVGDENPSAGSLIINDVDNKGGDNLAFAFVDTKNSINVTHKTEKFYNSSGKLSSIKISWEVKNPKDNAKIVVHAFDNNGNISSKIQKYDNTNPLPFIKIAQLQKSYFLNKNMKIYWETNLNEKIKITLLKDKKVERVIAEETDNTGEFSINLDDKVYSIGNNYSIVISGALSQKITDTSSTFSITAEIKDFISILKPNETYNKYFQNDKMTIAWNSHPSELKVIIQVIDTSGNEHAKFVVDTIFSTPAEFTWTIPYDFKPGYYYIRVSDKSNPTFFSESPRFRIIFNSQLKKLTILSPTDTTIAFTGDKLTTYYKSNYFSNFELWLSFDNSPIYKISDNLAVKDTLVNSYSFTLPKELLISKKYSLSFIDKDNYINKLKDIVYNSKIFLITINSIEEKLIEKTIKHMIESQNIIIFTDEKLNISEAKVYDVLGRCLFTADNINESSFKIPMSTIDASIIFVQLKIENKIFNYKVNLK